MAQVTAGFGGLQWRDTKHSRAAYHGDPWNELADRLAKHLVAHGSPLGVRGDLGHWVRSGDLENLSLPVAAFKQPRMWPSHVCDSMVDSGIEFGDTPASICSVPLTKTVTACSSSSQMSWHCLRIATVNVQTLESSDNDSFEHFEGRGGYLRDQLEALDAHIVSIRESIQEAPIRPVTMVLKDGSVESPAQVFRASLLTNSR